MPQEQPNKSAFDIFPRDQVEHYKMELARLQSKNEHLAGEVEYLRQALAAALSKIPQLAALQPYAQYFSLASPVLLMIVLLVLALLRALVSGDAYFMLNL
ncbi:MAG: hypothetical protein D6768_14530 [Chloroflexi bacterium]|nr:MAG: hypothetical protein D6768_14530 [Chloroflexota bacterium]